jgi:hypothetical protein
MALRIYQSTIADSESSVPWDDGAGGGLKTWLTATTTVRPLAFQGIELGGAITECVLQQDSEGGEVLHRLYKGPAIELDVFINQLVNDAVRAGAITPLSFLAEKGMKLTFTAVDGVEGIIVWNFCSDCGGKGTTLGAEAEAEG